MVISPRARRCALRSVATFWLPVLLLVGIAGPVQAQELRTEAEVVQAVRQHNLAIDAATARAGAEAERPAQVRWPFPMAEAMAMPQMLAEGEMGVGVMARQQIPWADRLRADREARQAMADAAAYEVGALERDQVLSAREAYAELWGLQEHADRIETFRNRLTLYRESALAQYRVGRGPQQAVLNLQVEADMLEQRTDALGERGSALRARLAVLSGGALRIRPADRLVAPRAPEHVDAETSALWVDGHPMVAASRAMREAEEAEARRRRTMLRPEFTVGATVNLSPMARAGMYGQEVVTPTVGVMVPLWRGGVRAEIREAEERARQRALEVEHARIVLVSELDDALAQLVRIRSRIARYENDLLPTAQQALEASLVGYQTGAVRFLELLDTQRMTFNIEVDLIEARVQEAILTARLEAIAGA